MFYRRNFILERSENRLENPVVLCVLALVCCALWGSAFPMIKLGYRFFDIPSDSPASQIMFAGIRFSIAGILAIMIGSISAKKVLIPSKKALPKVFILSLLQTVIQYIFFYIGLANTTGVKSSIINGSGVFWTILAAVAVFRMEKFDFQKVISCLLGFAGVVLVNLEKGGMDFSFSLVGEGFILISSISSALSTGAVKKFSAGENPVMLAGWQFFVGGLVMALCGFLLGGRLHTVTLSGILVLCWLAFVSACAYSLWSLLLKYHPVSKVAIFGVTRPLFGVALSALLLDEAQQFTWMTVTALILVTAGIAALYYRRGKESK